VLTAIPDLSPDEVRSNNKLGVIMKSMLKILAAVPFLFCWSGPSAAAGGKWLLVFQETQHFQWPYTPCINETLTMDIVFTGKSMPVAIPGGGYMERLSLSVAGTAIGDSSGHHYKVWAHEMMGFHGFKDGSTQSSDAWQWVFTPVDGGLKFRWEGNQVMKWTGEPWTSELIFDMNHNNSSDFNDWGNHTTCMGPSK
jgi:hypothetical protein